MRFLSRILDTNQREIDRLQKIVDRINSLEEKTKKLKDSDFSKKTKEFKTRIADGEKMEDILPEAYAVVREAAQRTLHMRPFDVQLVAGIALFEGKVAEQRTGEGKTLTAVAPLYLRALAEKGVHLVTVNDYLARIGTGWNAPLFDFLGLSVGVIVQEGKSFLYDKDYSDSTHGDERLSHLKPASRKEAYSADITYGTNNEFGFDYLRDNMVPTLSDMVQREHYFAIVDEVDSVLIDEARTPLIISAPDSEPTQKYYQFSRLTENLVDEEDYKIDEKARSASLTEKGIEKIEKALNVDNLYEKDFEAVHHIENALRARTLYLKDRDYIVKDNQVIIVDEFTGRLMMGRRWSDGLHQAVEAKEGVTIQQESKTLATISFQNYFRMYKHLSGMTGTAATEAEEFRKIYNLEVIVIPTHRPMIRRDHPDSIYKTLRGKYEAIAEEVLDLHKKGQPVLIGTTSIEKNEIVSQALKKKRIPHQVLNAKNHEKEATIISQAGSVGAVTVATNMAGRGVDIILGGAQVENKKWQQEHEKVVSFGGLHVIGTERHESRRIDNQLRGRAGRQGDPGSSRFYLSLEDDLMRIFGGEQIGKIMDRLKIPEDQAIENGLVSRAIESAQVKVEGFHFDTRKHLVEFDDVANQQREIVYKLRRRILESENLKEEVMEKLTHQIERTVLFSWPEEAAKPDLERVVVGLLDTVPFDDASLSRIKMEIQKITDKEKLKETLIKIIDQAHKVREKAVGSDNMRQIEKYAYLGAIDHLWIDHIDQIDDLRRGIELRRIGQRDPLVEFKKEAYDVFENLIDRIDEELSHRLFRLQITRPVSEIPLSEARENIDTTDQTGLLGDADQALKTGDSAFPKGESVKKQNKIGRNDPCFCGSGKKWKKCHYPKLPS